MLRFVTPPPLQAYITIGTPELYGGKERIRMNVKKKQIEEENQKRFSNKIIDRELHYLERELAHLKSVSERRELTPWELNRIMIIRECFDFVENN
jgi:hypothetical protein